MAAEENEDIVEEDDGDFEGYKYYEVPTIKCHNTMKVSSYVQHASQITFFSTSNSEPTHTNNVIVFYYKCFNERNIFLYWYKQVYSVIEIFF